ncbi:glycosyltransferase [Paenibacillus chitinolyticus]|uniref:glycosyltransferase n=1 Tax=Paenibacillus chitinolyticus TaxID=79263 RepID=UPI002DBFA32E|nr:glycosyltransferase [Paenibacillus chitinolyticus]MEC0245087.1 glycosyltransferase [Paenibacillus chitinolyticus]
MSETGTLHIQSVLYNNKQDRIVKSIESLIRAADFAIHDGIFSKISLNYGDGSSIPIFSEAEISQLNHQFGEYIDIHYNFFNSNLGSARGHNRIASNCTSEYILIMNPDILMAPDTILNLYKPFSFFKTNNIGIVEARQLPIEHPKLYNVHTGETSWASTACAMVPSFIFEEVKGFDAETFFLYCDDVDFSWRVRLHGYQIIHQPSAVIFHDKTLSKHGNWQTSDAEDYYSAEAGLLMAYKWSRNDLVEEIMSYFESSSEEYFKRALVEFRKREAEGRLPKQIDTDHKIGEFHNNNYGKMRFTL